MSITLDEVRAEALFAGDLQPSEHPPPERVRRSVTGMLRRYGAAWCAARMAQEFGDHPEWAAARMAWALQVVRDCYAGAARARTRCRPARLRRVAPTEPAGRVERVRCRYPTRRYRHALERRNRWC